MTPDPVSLLSVATQAAAIRQRDDGASATGLGCRET